LKEELSLQPYAGLMIINMFENFDTLNRDDLTIWGKCVENVYVLELEVLSASNATRFSNFVMDYVIKRKDDVYRQHAIKLVEQLKSLPEYLPLIEQGDEESLPDGPEEVKLMKKDIKDAPYPFIVDLIKFSITNNLK
jgi:hypothetical protein